MADYGLGVEAVRMVHLVSAATPFEAQVIAARLGAEGLVWELRGSVGGPFALGPVEVLVLEDDAATARELLLADEVEEAFAAGDTERRIDPGAGTWLVVAAVAFSVLFTLARLGVLA
jgi:hypothetical protein